MPSPILLLEFMLVIIFFVLVLIGVVVAVVIMLFVRIIVVTDLQSPKSRSEVRKGRCAYCGQSRPYSAEHVISAGLGCSSILATFICKECNDRFGHELEGPFLNDLVFFRNFCRIPGREGTIPDFRCEGYLDGQRVTVTFSGDGRVLIPPMPLKSAGNPQENEREFRVFKGSQDAVIEANLRRKHGDLVWRQVDKNDHRAIIDVRSEFDSSVLTKSTSNRCVAKYALNLIAWAYGETYVSTRFAGLKEYVQTGNFTGREPSGVIWDEQLFGLMQSAPPKHGFSLHRDADNHTVIVVLFLFFLFPFCVVADDSEIMLDSVGPSYTIDPYLGTLDPWLVTRIVPERRFCLAAANEDRGTLSAAKAVGQRAIQWFLEVCREQGGNRQSHLCYSCSKVLQQVTSVCPYCGNDPLPLQFDFGTI